MTGRLAARAVLIATVTSLFACGGASPEGRRQAETKPQEVPGRGPTVIRTATRYLQAYATQKPDEMAAMLDLSEPGSVAAAYAIHQIALVRAQRGGDVPLTAGHMTVRGDVVEMCFDVCATYGDLVGNPKENHLRSFTIDGLALEARLGLGDGSTRTVAGAQFQVVSAYRTVSGNALFVPIDVMNGTSRVVLQEGASYAGKGQQTTARQLLGPTILEPEDEATIAFVFPGIDIGGTLTLTVHADDRAQQSLELVVPGPIG